MYANELEECAPIVLMDAEAPKGLAGIEPLRGALEKKLQCHPDHTTYLECFLLQTSFNTSKFLLQLLVAHYQAVNPCRQSTGRDMSGMVTTEKLHLGMRAGVEGQWPEVHY
jgi:hypothetical protein